jgi:hypothetical protein
MEEQEMNTKVTRSLALNSAAVMLMTVACSSSTEKSPTEDQGVLVVALHEDLPPCDESVEGAVYYAADIDEFYYCDGEQMQEIDFGTAVSDADAGAVEDESADDEAAEEGVEGDDCFIADSGDGTNTVICGDGNNVTINVNASAQAETVESDDDDEGGDAGADAGPEPVVPETFVGPRQNFDIAELDGWTLCYQDVFGDFGASLADIEADCDGSQVMLACRELGSSTITLAAHTDRSVIFQEVPNGDNVGVLSNGSQWYFGPSWSWGFALGGDPLNRNSCDTESTNADDRLCFHTSGNELSSGYRCGATIGLNASADWERLIFTASP